MGLQLTFPSNGCAFVVGGSGGAGAAICARLAEAGSKVALTYHNGKERALRAAEEVERHGVASAVYHLEGSDEGSVVSAIEAAAERFDGIHSIIYAAGPRIEFLPVAEAPLENYVDAIAAEALTVLNLARVGITHLRRARGSFTACISFANRRVLDLDGLSAIPKAAVESTVRQLAAEEGTNRVRANCVGLGWIDVGLGASSDAAEQSLRESFGEDAIAALLKMIRLGRPGRGDELASAVVFLASEQASYITGQTLMADGGATL